MAKIKYCVQDVSADFGVDHAYILELLEKYLGKSKTRRAKTALTEEELNLIFEHFTQKPSNVTLADYFNTYSEELRRQKAEQRRLAAEKKTMEKQETAEPKQMPKAPAAPAPEEPKAEASEKPAEEPKPEKKPEAQKPRPQQKKQPAQKQTLKKAEITPKATPTGGVTFVEAVDTSTLAGATHIDTRKQVSVNLEKYDTRLDDMAGAVRDTRDSGKYKQKQKQKPNRKNAAFSKRESEAEKLRRLEQYERDKKKHLANIVLPEAISVSNLAAKLSMTNTQVVKKLMELGIMASASQVIDYDTAALVAEELGATVSKEVVVTIEDKLINVSEDRSDQLEDRCPVVVVMGHVDHGKTSILDAIRHTSVTAGEAGGITQHIGAYQVEINKRKITFLDTPGHAAFTSMRARGAQVTDIVILVVAGDDGIMPQTVEAINHAKAANVPIVVAVNKMDKPESNFDRVLQNLTEYELVPEQWGGDVICVPVSAVTKNGIDTLLENVLLVADVAELKANPNREAKGTVIEAKLDKSRGPVATVLVQNGTLHASDVLVAGTSVGRVRVMLDDKGQRIKDAGPSTPVEIVGLSEVPSAGDVFNVVKDERMARELVEQRKHEQKQKEFDDRSRVSLDDLFTQMQQGSLKTLNIIVKADVQGSAEAVKASLEKLSNEEVKVRVIHSAVGSVTESDIMLANASKAIIVGFNIRPDANVRSFAEKEGIDIRLYRIIYDCINEIEAAMKGMLAPKYREVSLGTAEVRQTFKVSGIGTIAGCYVKNGKITRTASARLVRDGIVVYEGKLDSLKRFKDDAREVAEGYECGLTLDKYNDIKEGDLVEAYTQEEIAR